MLDHITGSRSLYVVLAAFARQYRDVSQAASDRIAGILQRFASANDIIPASREREVLAEAESVIEQTFVGPDGRNAFASDGITPLAPFPTLLNSAIYAVVLGAVKPQSDYMKARLPDDIVGWLRRASPQLPAAYQSPYFWVDPNGYRLSDRVWQTSIRTRVKVDGLLSEGIRTGKSARDLSSRLEQFLLPGRAPIRTNKPYGTDGSFDGMRLARSEIARAHGEATLRAAQSNPFVSGVDWMLSVRHPRFDHCDDLATIGIGGNRIRDPYPPGQVPSYPDHPQCICVLVPTVSESASSVAARLRVRMQAGEAAPYTPYDADSFVSELLGVVAVASLIARVL
jgi:hypothetical protein